MVLWSGLNAGSNPSVARVNNGIKANTLPPIDRQRNHGNKHYTGNLLAGKLEKQKVCLLVRRSGITRRSVLDNMEQVFILLLREWINMSLIAFQKSISTRKKMPC